MSIDVAISINQNPNDIDYKGSIEFNFLDGYYAFLDPLFEKLSEKTGEVIDLWGDAIFKGDDLVELRNTIGEGLALVEKQPSEWEVLCARKPLDGDPDKSGWDEVNTKVSRDKFIALLNDFKQLTERAIEKGEYVVCIGD